MRVSDSRIKQIFGEFFSQETPWLICGLFAIESFAVNYVREANTQHLFIHYSLLIQLAAA